MKRALAILLAVLFAAALFTGCGNAPAAPATAAPGASQAPATQAPATQAPATNAPATQAPATQAPATQAPATEAPITAAPEGPQNYLAPGNYTVDSEGWPTGKYTYTLPLTTKDITFDMMTINYTPQYIPEDGMAAIPIWAEEIRMTGVNMEYVIASAQNCKEMFATMLASDDLCDITAQGQNRYSGPLREAIEEDWFVNIADYREYIPNYLYEIHERAKTNPNIYDTVFLDKNTAAVFYSLYTDRIGDGWFIREDKMEKLGLGKAKDVITIEDLHQVFLAQKVAYGDEGYIPMGMYNCLEKSGGKMFSGYNTAMFSFSTGYYKRIRDGHVEYCGTTEDDKAAMTTFSTWFAEGLIDPNYASISANADYDAQLIDGKIGYVFLPPDDAARRSRVCVDPDCSFMPTPRLRLYEGQILKYGLAEGVNANGSYTVSCSCEDIPLCLTWIDWKYSDEGSDYISWGPEGTMWEYNDKGQRMLTDFVLKSEAGSTWMLCLYGANIMSDGGLVNNLRTIATSDYDLISEMIKVWDVSGYYDGEYEWRNGVTLDSADSAEVSSLSADVNTYYAENYAQFIDGSRKMDEWDSFVGDMMELGLAKVLEIYDAAYQAYLSRQ